jgi:uncharacterized protein
MNLTSDIAFTDSVKRIQERKGSRHAYARMEQGAGWQSAISGELKAFIEDQISVFLATVNAEGQPYIQHRGGPAGFLRVLDAQTIAFVDFSGNRHFISTGNMSENPKAHLFLIDYEQQTRVKIWGEARVVEDAELMEQLMPANYQARGEQVIVFTVKAWDANCPKHIPVRYEAADVERALAQKDVRIAALEAELRQLRSA